MKNRPDPSSPEAPKYWMHETGGELAAAIKRYLRDEPLTARDVQLIGAYFRQWIDSPVWDGNPMIDEPGRINLMTLRVGARFLHMRADITKWLDRAAEAGMDPL